MTIDLMCGIDILSSFCEAIVEYTVQPTQYKQKNYVYGRLLHILRHKISLHGLYLSAFVITPINKRRSILDPQGYLSIFLNISSAFLLVGLKNRQTIPPMIPFPSQISGALFKFRILFWYRTIISQTVILNKTNTCTYKYIY